MALPIASAQHAIEARVQPREDALAGRFVAELADGASLTLRSREGERAIISSNKQALWSPTGPDPSACLAPQITVHPTANGADITFDFDNTTADPKWLGLLYVGGIRFSQTIQKRLFEADGKEITASHRGKPIFDGGDWYPGGLYSPVATLRDGEATIGVSLQYPVLEYRHRVFIRVESPGGVYASGGQNWQVMIQLSPTELTRPQRDIAPGERRRYVVSVRAASGDPKHDWMRTLAPYRDYFRATYGGVRYQRDPRPVGACEIAGTSPPTPDNPRGFAYQERRIDQHGWQPWLDVIADMRRRGYQRVMLIAPTGVFFENRQNNYPFQFTTGWKDLPRAREDLPLLARLGLQMGSGGLGLWWGRSAQVMTTWDTPRLEVLDPERADHRTRAFRELDLAVALNTTVVGLDAFNEMPAWDGYRWLQQMRARYPKVKFIAESLAPDFIHTLAGTYVYGLRSGATVDREPAGPFVIADFLVPGHETWARVDAGSIKARHELPPSADTPDELVALHVGRLARWGYVPIVHAPGTVHGVEAAVTWEKSVPADLHPSGAPR